MADFQSTNTYASKKFDSSFSPNHKQEINMDEENDISLLFKNKKKRKNKDKEPETPPLTQEDVDDEDMTYDEMLQRLYAQMEPSTSLSKRVRIQAPKLSLIGSKRTGWTNFEKTAEALHRDPFHLSSFLEAELGTNVSHAKEGLLVIKGRFKTIQIESLLKKYVDKYLKCKTCSSHNTLLVRNQLTRLTSQQCTDCKSEWTVETILKATHGNKKENT